MAVPCEELRCDKKTLKAVLDSIRIARESMLSNTTGGWIEKDSTTNEPGKGAD